MSHQLIHFVIARCFACITSTSTYKLAGHVQIVTRTASLLMGCGCTCQELQEILNTSYTAPEVHPLPNEQACCRKALKKCGKVREMQWQ